MFVRKILMLVALCALAVVGAGSASAASYLHSGTTSGNLTMGPISSSTLDGHANLTTGVGNLTCPAATFGGDVTTNNGGATVTGQLTTLTFTNCTGTQFLAGITSCHLTQTAANNIHGTANPTNDTGGTLVAENFTETCSGGGVQCSFTAPSGGVSGAVSETYSSTGTVTANSLAFSNATVNSTGGLCPTTGAFTATWTNVRAGSTTTGPLVALNPVA